MDADSGAPNGNAGESRRKSGRVSRRPELYAEAHHHGSVLANGSAAKRKRPSTAKATEPDDSDGDDEDQDVDRDSEDSGDESEEEADDEEEETRPSRRGQRSKAATAKPAAKRAKTTNGSSTTLAIRTSSTKTATKSAKSKARARPSQAHQNGLYAEVFGRGNSAEDAAVHWKSLVDKDSVAAICDLINFVFQCIGCDSRVESSDIEDMDSIPTKLGDILLEYEQQKPPDYPLISKAKQFVGFQDVLEEFFAAIIKTLHNSNFFYDYPEIYDNIHVWVATMSGANYKSFRHTATIISLSMSTALCGVAQELQQMMANFKTQIDAEKKKRASNKKRLQGVEEQYKSCEKKLEAVDAQLRDAFDTVYVHRYRDVEERIRAPCVAALGSWITLYRKMFLEGQYLRYLGWVLNDTSAATRLEDIKQLKILFKSQRNIGALRAFADRFRSRLVEMGARDADIGVRVETIELLDRLRDAELLEPDDIDTVGRLIFDTEARVRKSVGRFFVSNLEDLYKASTEDFDEAQYNAALSPSDQVDDFLSPCQSWIKFKCLGSSLTSYDNDAESQDRNHPQSTSLNISSDSRYVLATQSIFPYMDELQEWQALAGYLLYDHSSIPSSGDEEDVAYLAQQAYKLSPGEEAILLDVLYSSITQELQSITESQAEKKGRKLTKTQIRQKQESTAQDLTDLLPLLLSKYGSTPQNASSILRILQLLDLEHVSDLQAGETSYATILDDISKQFTSHSDRKVLAAASVAFRNARAHEQSKEATDSKVQEIWSESISSLTNLLRGKVVPVRGSLERPVLSETVNIVSRLAELAGVYDCSSMIESRLEAPAPKKRKSRATDDSEHETLLALLLDLLKRGEPDEDTTEEFAQMEDVLCTSLIELFSRYFRWKVFGLKKAIEANDKSSLGTGDLTNLAMTKTTFAGNLTSAVSARAPLDPVRYTAIVNLLELFALMTTIRNMRPSKGSLDAASKENLDSLITSVPADLVTEVTSTHEKTLKSFAKKTGRKIEAAGEKTKGKKGKEHTAETQEEIEAPPEDSDAENEDEDDDEDDEDDGTSDDGAEGVPEGRDAKKQAALLMEQRLCELTSKIIFAIVGGAVAGDAVRAQVLRNRTRLGKNYSALCAYLDEPKEKTKKKQQPGAAKAKTATGGEQQQQQQPQEQQKEAAAAIAGAAEEDHDDIEDSEDDGDPTRVQRRDDDEDALREQGLLEDEDENDEVQDNEDAAEEQQQQQQVRAEEDDDEIMGD